MKELITTGLAVIMLIIGLSLLLYPTVSNQLQSEGHQRAIYNYLESVSMLSDEDYTQILEEAQAYNAELCQHHFSLQLFYPEQLERYWQCLNVAGNGLMGYIDIEKVKIHLPIYHGVAEEILQVGVGHLEGTSLPVGGETAHTLLSGHRGLPSALLFTNLDKLEIGDIFTLIVLDEAYRYQVDEIQVILPTEAGFLNFEEGKDYCTLVTCTPYGINSHRLLIRGKRMEISPEEEKLSVQAGVKNVNILIIIGILEVPVLMISVSVSASIESKRFRRKKVNRR